MKNTNQRPSRTRRILCGFGLGLLMGSVFLLGSCSQRPSGSGGGSQEDYLRLTREGKKAYDSGNAAKAIPFFEQAATLQPTNRDANLNLANAYLLANQAEKAIAQAERARKTDTNSAAAPYLIGSAHLRLGQGDAALRPLQLAKEMDRAVNAVSYQLGRALQQLGNFEAASKEFEEVVEFEPNHQAAYYNLSQTYQRLGKTNEAAAALAQHQKVTASKAGQLSEPSRFERCRYTRIQAPFKLEQPANPGVPVKFVDVTLARLGAGASNYHGPVAVHDLQHNGYNSLVVGEGSNTVRFLRNATNVFEPAASLVVTGVCEQALIGDFNNDEVSDLLLLGSQASHLIRLTTNGSMTDITRPSMLQTLQARRGVLLDIDYSGTLDLVTIPAGTNGLALYRNLGGNIGRSVGQPYFVDSKTNLNLPPGFSGARQLLVEDWNGDDLLDVIVARDDAPPILLAKERAGALVATNAFAALPRGGVLAIGDVNNDQLPDLVAAVGGNLVLWTNGASQVQNLAALPSPLTQLKFWDYDNDGWLDLIGSGAGTFVWRNLGAAGFQDVTASLGLDQLGTLPVQSFAQADFDGDCDTDLILALEGGGVRLLRNDGGNANHQLKIHLVGKKSNSSGLGLRIEINAEGLQTSRRITELPVEIGVGKNALIDSLIAHWFDFDLNLTDIQADQCAVVPLLELQINFGSCPFLYAWDGQGFRFVTDILGAAPLGLPLSEARLIDADPQEYIWVGNESNFPLRNGKYVLQVTEELREILYLDEAKLVAVDHPAGTEVHSSGKLLPAPPYPLAELLTLQKERPLRQALNDKGDDVTAALRDVDRRFVSPPELRAAQLMGLAAPHHIILDFGPLENDRPLVLAITAWLRFGGATVNIAASHDRTLPMPFPILEVETAPGVWTGLDLVAGAPAGKTKNYLIELKLPPNSRRLRLSTAFEIHWDRIALLEKSNVGSVRTTLAPAAANLHWRGFSEYRDLPSDQPLTPSYQAVHAAPIWRWAPEGFVTRYGPVDELIADKDNALALLSGGDELTLEFDPALLPPKRAGYVRDFFFYAVGWDKDADIHCVRGNEVGPLPWHGMNDQRYGQQERPSFPNDPLMDKMNTRAVGGRVISRAMR